MNQKLNGIDHAIEAVRTVERLRMGRFRLHSIDDNGDGTCEVLMRCQFDDGEDTLILEFDKALLIAEVKKLT